MRRGVRTRREIRSSPDDRGSARANDRAGGRIGAFTFYCEPGEDVVPLRENAQRPGVRPRKRNRGGIVSVFRNFEK